MSSGNSQDFRTREEAEAYAKLVQDSWYKDSETVSFYVLEGETDLGFGEDWFVQVRLRCPTGDGYLSYRVNRKDVPPHAVYLAVNAMSDAFNSGHRQGQIAARTRIIHLVDRTLNLPK